MKTKRAKTKTANKSTNTGKTVWRNFSQQFSNIVDFIEANLDSLNSLVFSFTEMIGNKRVKIENAKCEAHMTKVGDAVLKVPNFKLAKQQLPELKSGLNKLDKLLTSQGFQCGKTVLVRSGGSAVLWIKSSDQTRIQVVVKPKAKPNTTAKKKAPAKKKAATKKAANTRRSNK